MSAANDNDPVWSAAYIKEYKAVYDNHIALSVPPIAARTKANHCATFYADNEKRKQLKNLEQNHE